MLNDPVAEIARAAQVSQPTVIRFCRTLGCEGLSDFKLRLASGLTGTVPVTHTQVTGDDSVLELGTKVLGNTAASILQVRDHLNRDSIDRGVGLITAAHRVDCFAVGYSGAAAHASRSCSRSPTWPTSAVPASSRSAPASRRWRARPTRR